MAYRFFIFFIFTNILVFSNPSQAIICSIFKDPYTPAVVRYEAFGENRAKAILNATLECFKHWAPEVCEKAKKYSCWCEGDKDIVSSLNCSK